MYKSRGASGDVICQGTTRVQCNGTQWVVVEENSPQCGYQPPPTSDDNTLVVVGVGVIAAIGIGALWGS